MKLSEQQLEALKTMRTEMIPTDSPDHKKVSLNALEAKGLAVQVKYVSGTFFAISEKGRAFFNNQNKPTDALLNSLKKVSAAFDNLKLAATAASETIVTQISPLKDFSKNAQGEDETEETDYEDAIKAMVCNDRELRKTDLVVGVDIASKTPACSLIRKWVVCVIFALTATISYGQQLPDLSSAIIGQTITLNDYKVVKDTVKSNLIISITGSPALIVTEGYVIREGLKFGGSWAMGNDGVYYKYIGYLDGDKNPFSPRTLVWQFKINE